MEDQNKTVSTIQTKQELIPENNIFNEEIWNIIFNHLTTIDRMTHDLLKEDLPAIGVSLNDHKALIIFPCFFVCRQLRDITINYVRNSLQINKLNLSRFDLTFALTGGKDLLVWSMKLLDKNNLDANTFAFASLRGDIELLNFLLSLGFQVDKSNTRCCSYAVKSGNLEVLKWVRNESFSWDESTSSNIAISGNLEMLKWAKTHQCPWDEKTCSLAAFNGHLELLKWARENVCPWNEDTCNYAAENGHLEVLKWARENFCPWNEKTCALAAKNGHLEVLKWARENNCPWDKSTSSLAACNGHVDVLKYAIENKCPYSRDEIYQYISNLENQILNIEPINS